MALSDNTVSLKQQVTIVITPKRALILQIRQLNGLASESGNYTPAVWSNSDAGTAGLDAGRIVEQCL